MIKSILIFKYYDDQGLDEIAILKMETISK